MRYVSIPLALLILAGCGSSSSSGTHQPAKATQVVSTALPSRTGAARIHGQYTDPGTGMTAVASRLVLKSRPRGLRPAPAGYFWELIDIRLRNGGKTAHDYTAADFLLTNQRHQLVQPIPLPGTGNAIKQGSLKPGGTISGTLAYQVSLSTRQLALTWSDSNKLSPPVKLVQYSLLSVK